MDDPLDRSMYRGAGINDYLTRLPIVGDLFSSFGVETAAEVNKKRAMQRMQRLMMQFRPEQIQTRLNALDNAMSLFKPVNRALTKAYGAGAAMPLEQATRSPFSDQAMAQMRQQAGASSKRPYYFPPMEVLMEGKPSGVGK